jgi:hypothetical protein
VLRPAPADAFRPAAGPVRALRSLAVALVCTLTASGAHVAAGGTIPAGAVVTVLVASAAVAGLLSARRVTPGQMIGLLLLCQVCVHLGCSTGEMTMSLTMVAGHLAATAISAAALARGEAFVWRLAERLALRATPLRAAASPVPTLRPLAPVVATRSPHDVRLAHTRVERGPPSGL